LPTAADSTNLSTASFATDVPIVLPTESTQSDNSNPLPTAAHSTDFFAASFETDLPLVQPVLLPTDSTQPDLTKVSKFLPTYPLQCKKLFKNMYTPAFSLSSDQLLPRDEPDEQRAEQRRDHHCRQPNELVVPNEDPRAVEQARD